MARIQAPIDRKLTLSLCGRVRDDATEELRTAAGAIRETADPCGAICGAGVDDGGKRHVEGATHDVADTAAVSQSRQDAPGKILIYLGRLRAGDLAHHRPMSSLHHAAERRVKGEVLERTPVID